MGTGHDAGAIISVLPLWIILIPIVGSAAIYAIGRYKILRNVVTMGISAVALGLSLILWIMAKEGVILYEINNLLSFGLTFRIDYLGAIFTLLSSLIWFLATLFSWVYMEHEERQTRYYTYLMLTLGGCLGVFLAGDLFTLFLFFELMSLASYVLVIHVETTEAMDAGQNYLYLSIFGGLCLLTGIIFLYGGIGVLSFEPLLEMIEGLGYLKYIIAGLLIIGFGIKAGMVPLHIWLPKAHPIAPSPASALLSGIMIKAGAYGIIRVVNMIYTPASGAGGNIWHFTHDFGYFILWIGIITMFIAAFIALFEENAKRILAYSSISQMGYILMGVGCASYLGYEGAMGFSGTMYHILNHAFFKAGLFMMVGAVYMRTHELRLSRLGGLWQDLPVTMTAFVIAAAGIAGVPGFNGYASKTLLHHAVEEVFYYHGDVTLFWAEKIFMLTSAFTVCYITKLCISIFFGKKPTDLNVRSETLLEKLVFGTIAVAVLLPGLIPSLTLKGLIIPMAEGFTYNSYMLEYVQRTNIWTWPDLQGIFIALALGIALFLAFNRSDLFKVKLPGYLSVEYLIYHPVINGALSAFTSCGQAVDKALDGVFVNSINLYRLCAMVKQFDEKILNAFGSGLSGRSSMLRDNIYGGWIMGIKDLYRRQQAIMRRIFMLMLRIDVRPQGSEIFETISTMNIDFSVFIVMITIALVLGVYFFSTYIQKLAF